jgi:FAS-associated factor 2
MSQPEVDLDQLSDSEKSTLEMYMAVTSQEPSEAIPLLRRSQWNLQVSLSSPAPGQVYGSLTDPRTLDCHIQVL